MTENLAQSSRFEHFLYIGTYGKGIYAFGYDAAGPSFKPLGLVGEIVNPSFLAADPQHRFLYAVSELEGKAEGSVGAFLIDRETGKLKLLNTAPSGGIAPCHLAVDHTARFLAVANYSSGSVAGFHLERDGSLGAQSSLEAAKGSSVNPKRQEGPHAHQVVFSSNNKYLYVPDLGLDQIRIYDLSAEDGRLSPHERPHIEEKRGFGPRHMAFSPDERFAYLLNELESMVTVFEHDAESAMLRPIQTVSSLPGNPSDRDGGAEILVHPTGKFVYASNRGPGTIAVYQRNSGDGKLKQVQTAATGGTFPRGMEIDPSNNFLLVGDQKGSRFFVLKIDQVTGELSKPGQALEVPSPVSFLFLPAGYSA